MRVTTDLPFDFCSTCLMHDYEVCAKDLYSYDEVQERSLSICCKNEHLCKGLYNNLKAHLGVDNGHENTH